VSALRRLFIRIGEFLAGRQRAERELSDEVQSHLDHVADEYVRRGMTRDAALRAARRDFGGVEGAKESVRDAQGLRPLETLGQDVAYAVRLLRKSPSFAIVAIVTLALGIGANTAIFSMVDAVMLRPLPYPHPDRLVALAEFIDRPEQINTSSGGGPLGDSGPTRETVSPANYVDYAKLNSFQSLAGYASAAANLTNAGTPERLAGEAVTSNYFDLLGGRPLIGRALQPSDDEPGAPNVIVLSHGLWQRKFNGDAAIVGQSIVLNGEPVVVVGVMPPTFRGISTFAAATTIVDYWMPPRYPPDALTNRGDHEIHVAGRLREGVTIEQANAELRGLSDALSKQYPQTNAHTHAELLWLSRDLVSNARTSLWATLAMIALILVIACVNVANLLIVRGVARRREVAVRLALGAARGRIVRELLTQSLVLAAAGGLAGLAVAYWTQELLLAIAPANTPRLDQVSLDARVLGVSTLLVVATGVLFGLLPAWQASREQPVDAIRSTGRVVAGTNVMRWRTALMAVEVALSAVLLVGAGLTYRSLDAMNRVNLGFQTEGVLAMNVSLPPSKYRDGNARFAFFDELAARLRALPGVTAVGFANRLPLRGGWSSGYLIDGVPPPPSGYLESDFQAVSAGYFDVLDIAVTAGRGIEAGDLPGREPVAIVSESFRKLLPEGRDPVGVIIQRGPNAPKIRVVGVVNDVRRDGKLESLNPQVYLPAAQSGSYPVHLADLAVRTEGDPTALVPAIQRQIWAIDPDQPITNVRPLDEVLFQRGSAQRFRALLFGLCAVLALVLSLVGVYGVVSYAVSQRTPEIGVRMALGASRGDILRWLVGRTAVMVVLSTIAGLVIASGLSKTLDALLFGVTSADAVTYGVAATALIVVAIGAAAAAARRGALIDPSSALRGE
jgi:putative ABC transport system permease protein